MFGDRGSIVGNPNLAPAEGNNYAEGFGADLQQTFGAPGLFELTYFRSEVKNLITFIQNSQRTARATNIGRAEINGIEASFQIEPYKKWSLTGNYTWQDAIDDSAVAFWRGNKLPGIHEQQMNLGVRNAFGRDASWYYEWSRDSGNYLDRANTRPVPTRNMANAGLTVRSGEFTASFEVKNIGDDQISDVAGFPLPGRAFYFTLTREMR
jgi:iron complex outermembrane receptor protein